eukprot:scaffold183_cov249-Pinguiococcus_pyrenoidosus.AAC.6
MAELVPTSADRPGLVVVHERSSRDGNPQARGLQKLSERVLLAEENVLGIEEDAIAVLKGPHCVQPHGEEEAPEPWGSGEGQLGSCPADDGHSSLDAIDVPRVRRRNVNLLSEIACTIQALLWVVAGT